MSVTTATKLKLGPAAAGVLLSSEEFDAAEFEPGWRYGLIRGVLIVNPAPLPEERGPNELLGHWSLVVAIPGNASSRINLGRHAARTRYPDRRPMASCGPRDLGWPRTPAKPLGSDTPTIAVEFVSEGKQNLMRDYEVKRDEYLTSGIREYWVIDRFQRTLTVFVVGAQPQVIQESARYESPLLPGFILDLSELLAMADRWTE